MNESEKSAGLDLVWGLREIGKIINRSERQVHYLASTGAIPVKQVMGRWCADRSELVAFFKGRAAA